ncbi:MAG TPA: TetR/AcrR family transcriptional regulator [Kineosporiaceae bacterium]|nr:TetR/AcrR family transcriptional regulator [Kineosporiaceae bacterium]
MTRLLDACAEVLDEVGYDALTTREVARRAEVPIGTLYQFFGGKQALCGALAQRNLEEWVRRMGVRFTAAPVGRWSDTAPVVVGEFVVMKRSVPGFGAVDFGDARPGRDHMLDGPAGEENNALVARRLAEFGIRELGLGGGAAVEPVLRVAVEVTDGLLRLAFRADREGDPALIAEAEWLLRSYLSARLP